MIPNRSYSNFKRLAKWLNYQLSSTIIFVLSWFYGVTLPLLIIAALIFSPIMLKLLYEEKKSGWIIAFIIMVVIPLLLIFIPVDSGYLKFILMFIPLGMFYFYCFLLRFTVNDWLSEERAKALRLQAAENKTDYNELNKLF